MGGSGLIFDAYTGAFLGWICGMEPCGDTIRYDRPTLYESSIASYQGWIKTIDTSIQAG
jgi:hypothetical protein